MFNAGDDTQALSTDCLDYPAALEQHRDVW